MDAAATTSDFFTKPGLSPERKALYERMDAKNTAPLWEALARLVTPEPRTPCVPALWKYDEIRPILMEAGKLLSVKEAERRVFVLENPGIRGISQITQSLYAGIQLVERGEIAPSHRHVASALRFVIESNGAYTAVEGERTTMRPGDFILTPSWTWHDHGNGGDGPAVWLDGLDVPIVNLFDTSFAEHHPQETQPVERSEGDAHARYGASMLPLEYQSPRMSAPIFSYPYDRSREALHRLQKSGPIHPCHGVKMQYVNPATGGYPMPTIAAFLQLLPNGFRGRKYRSTDATVFCVSEGKGRTQVGDTTLTWGKSDVFVVPSWMPVSHEPQGEAVLFSFSDRAAQKALGLWREESLN
jgi:gentisate 1,2-dioxygenase